MTKQKCNHNSIAKGVGENFYSCIMCGEKDKQIKECPTCKTLKESNPTPDGDEVCVNCGDKEMMDITYVGGTFEVPSWEEDKIFKCLYLLADEKVIDDVVDRFKTLIRRTIKSERKSAYEQGYKRAMEDKKNNIF